MNTVFYLFVLISFAVTSFNEYQFDSSSAANQISPMLSLGNAILNGASDAATLAISLIGVMSLFLGLIKVAESTGLLIIIGKVLRPLLTKLFNDIPEDSPAMGAIVLNLSCNALGLGNAATPFGIRAMEYMNELNNNKKIATNSMILFLAINTSSVTLIPTSIIALRAASGSSDPASIVATTLFATICSTFVAIIMAKFLQRFSTCPNIKGKNTNLNDDSLNDDNLNNKSLNNVSKLSNLKSKNDSYPFIVSLMAIVAIVCFIPICIFYGKYISSWVIPVLMIGLLTFGFVKKVPVYESFTIGAKEGFEVAVRIIPYLVAILVAVAMLKNSGALDYFVNHIGKYTSLIGLPSEALPLALLRPISGSGSLGLLASTLNDPSIGPDSYIGYLVSTIQGSTETTFYVLAVYFGAVQITKIRHALYAALAADVAGIAASVFIVNMIYK